MKKPAFPTAYFVGFMFAILVLILSLVNLFSGRRRFRRRRTESWRRSGADSRAVGMEVMHSNIRNTLTISLCFGIPGSN